MGCFNAPLELMRDVTLHRLNYRPGLPKGFLECGSLAFPNIQYRSFKNHS